MFSVLRTRVPLALLCLLALVSFVHGPLASPAAAGEDKEEEEKWDVSNPPGPKYDVPIDTDEGTWLSVDVSPDGQKILFDLLGDIYVMPITGGEATALTSGLPWDEHPRFSPDGKWIAYTSDRDGGDNIWVMKADGSDPKQVTKEDFRLLNSPTWTPDSEYIAARKHFTSTRSAGAGEIWLYHRTGGSGLQMTKRPNDQKDLGEPAISPDGRYLYYSQDATPGSRFQYNKDPNTQIYVIKRLDRVTGDTDVFIAGPGGSIRPTPSPDGNHLAFIRRVRGKSVLFVANVESGEERALYDGLDRDLQETWAIHGVYPQMAWTPDSRNIVFWSGGKIRKLDLASNTVAEIPFRVRDTREIREAVRSSYDPAPESFHTKMLQWVQVAPDGKRVVFQALGKLYVRNLPDGKPKRLTKQEDHDEFYPAWSRDSKSIVYVTWSDRDLGSVRVVSAGGGRSRELTTEPGHYVEPAFSPDGTRVVYRKVGGGWLRTPEWSRNQGVYQVAAKGGAEPQLVTKSGYEPHFGAENARVFLFRVGGDDRDERTLFSVDLDGSDERDHAKGVYFTEVRVSPDEKWLAFKEGFNVYIMPFVRTGRLVEFGPKANNLPVTRVSKTAGDYLHWSGASDKLYWSMGPELFERDLREAFAFLPEAPEELPEPPQKGIDIGFDVVSDVPTGSLAFVGARIITMNGDEVIRDGTILVEGNKIVEVGRSSRVQVPEGTHTIDVAGKTIMPGIVDVHWHGAMGTQEIVPQQSWTNYASLAFGVTTLHDPSNDTSEIFAASELQRAGHIVAPRIFSTGTILYGAKGSFKAQVDGLDDARAHLQRLKAVGAFSVKSYNQPRRNQRQQVLQAARELDMLVFPEGGSLYQHNINMVVDGHTGIEHSIPVASVYKDVEQLWGHTQVGYTPTLVVGYGGLWGENYWYGKTQVWANDRLLRFVPRRVIDARSRRPLIVPPDEYGHMYNARTAKQLLDAGVRVQVGAHGQREGLGSHWETWMFVQGGMDEMEALRAATLDGARYIGMEKHIGSIQSGMLADFLVLDKNPLDDIYNSESVRYTVLNGRVYDAWTMDELGNHPQKRQSFWFETTATSPTAAFIEQHQHRCGGCTQSP